MTVALQGFTLLTNIFFPENDKPIYTAELNLPIGTPIERTEEIVEELEYFMQKELMADSAGKDGIVNWSTYLGQGPPMFTLGFSPEQANPGYACLIVNTTTGGPFLDNLIQKTENYCLEHFPDVRPKINRLQIGPPPDAPVAIRILGKELDEVYEISLKVKAKLATVAGTKNIHDDWGQRTKKMLVKINQARAKRAGVSNQDIAFSLQTALSGIETTQYREKMR